ncbi:MAG: (2Fe-2S) ferredoxin domain-containing protein [Firmicutes bacterium]|jgi:NADH:ubiquinone oxidoreductase subunit E|nr:(2Fe-2S) ferredoxin domain-containing protein [Bacillota bacterium]MDH7496220.1 (2Fe-2S) ferredoxin domain-containing protein [Bacillota bacterium]
MRGAVPVLTIFVCVGSSCFLRGAPDVIKAFEAEIERRAPGQVELKGTFCQDLCTLGVTVRIGSKVFSGVRPDDVPRLFDTEVVPLIESACER